MCRGLRPYLLYKTLFCLDNFWDVSTSSAVAFCRCGEMAGSWAWLGVHEADLEAVSWQSVRGADLELMLPAVQFREVSARFGLNGNESSQLFRADLEAVGGTHYRVHHLFFLLMYKLGRNSTVENIEIRQTLHARMDEERDGSLVRTPVRANEQVEPMSIVAAALKDYINVTPGNATLKNIVSGRGHTIADVVELLIGPRLETAGLPTIFAQLLRKRVCLHMFQDLH